MHLTDYFLNILQEEFKKRKDRNHSYSMRAFALSIGIEQSNLSKILRKKSKISPHTMMKVALKLNLSKVQLKKLEYEISKRGTLSSEISESIFLQLADWRYWAILEFLKINPLGSPESIAREFGISKSFATRAISNLEKLQFIRRHEGEYLLLSPNNSWNNRPLISEKDRKKLQEKYLLLSMKALRSVALQKRHHSSLTVSIDPNDLPAIKEKILEFQSQLGGFCQSKSKLEKVYQLSISFYPLSKTEV